MRIMERETGSDRIRLRIENIDDLWHLFNIIRQGDLAFSLAQRREEKAADKIRDKRGEKRTIFLGIEVDRLEFHEFSDRLRVHGTILPDQQDSGSYHTFNLQVGTEVSIQKKEWQEHELQRLETAESDGRKPVVVMVSLDEDEAFVSVLRQYGVQEIATVRSGRSGKQYAASGKKEDYFGEVLDVLMVQGKELPMIISGPGFAKENLVAYLRDRLGDEQSVLAVSTGQTGKAGINEVLKSGAISRLTEGSRLEYETTLMEQVLKELATRGKVAYGLVEVRKVISTGAADIVLITDTRLREDREVAEELLTASELAGAKVAIISATHDSGKQLSSLGGYAALLRFVIHES